MVVSRTRVTKRDRSFLLALARTRYLSTTLGALLLFNGSRQIMNRRARKLLDLGLIRCWVPALSEDNVYGLTLAGRRLLEQSGEDLPDVTQCPRGLDAQWRHAVGINGVRVRLAIDLDRHGATLCWWRCNRELRSAGRQRTIPDALFAIEWPDGTEQVYALELEYRTRAPQSFLRKVARYAGAPFRPGGMYGTGRPIVLVVGHDPMWLERYRLATSRLAIPIPIGFTALAEVASEGPTAPIWRTTVGRGKHCLQELGNCGYRNYSLVPETFDEHGGIASPAAHIPTRTFPAGTQGQSQ